MIRITFLIMLFAPIGVFALIASTITNMAGEDPSQILSLLGSLAWYCLAVIIGLLLHACIVYLGLLKTFTPLTIPRFFGALAKRSCWPFPPVAAVPLCR